jgi:hypothetical protein
LIGDIAFEHQMHLAGTLLSLRNLEHHCSVFDIWLWRSAMAQA